MRRTLGTFELLAVAIAAMLVARATAGFVEVVVRGGTPVIDVASTPGAITGISAFAPVRAKSADVILGLNVFCSTCPRRVQGPAGGEREKGGAGDLHPLPSVLPLQVVVTMVAPLPHDRGQSLTLIQDIEKSRTGMYRVGMTVRDALVVDIQATRVYLLRAGRREYLDLLGQLRPAQTRAATAPHIEPALAELVRGIKKVRELQYEIPRATVDSLLGNVRILAQSARVLPEVRDGAAVGLRLLGVKADGPFAAIGLQSGDVIRTINGLELATADMALQAYAKLKAANHLSIDIERTGRRTTIDYSIR